MTESIAQLRAQLAAVDAPAVESDPTALLATASNAEKVEILTWRRKRFSDEANGLCARAEGEGRSALNPTEALFAMRLLSQIAAIDEVLPRYAERADADRQHAETMRQYGVPTVIAD